MATRKRIKKRETQIDIGARVIRATTKRSDVSRQKTPSDGTSDSPIGSLSIATPYDMSFLHKAIESSNILGACVNAYVVNISGYGYRVVPYEEDGTMDPTEKKVLRSFIEAPNPEESLRALSANRITDLENYGFAFIEVSRDRRGRVSLLHAVKSFYMRLTPLDSQYVEVVSEVDRGGRRGRVKERKRFRRYVQNTNGSVVHFKEFGDPRRLSYKTGRFEGGDYKVPDNELATEILHQKLYSEEPYGVPRWIAHLPSMIGSRESEEVNMRYFEDNTVPPMALMVSGGRLTRESFQNLTNMLNGQGVGKERQNQIMLIEAIPETTGLDDKGTMSIKVEKLSDVRPSDGLFKEYDDSNRAKIKSAFRLPSVLLGDSENATFATSNVSTSLAETQVFLPERMTHDEFLNQRLINNPRGLGLKTVKLESMSPRITNPDQIIKTLTAVNVMGGVTPRKAIAIVNETMQLSLEQYPHDGEEGYEEWMDQPMQLAQKLIVAPTQQTGEGVDPVDQKPKTQDIKDREKNGATGIDDMGVENGQQ